MSAPAVAQDQPAPHPCKPLLYKAMTPAECRRNYWMAIIEADTTIEQLMQSSLWSVLSSRLSQLDRIECIWADRSRYAELLVLNAGAGHVSLHLLSEHKLPSILTTDPGSLPVGFDIIYAGPIVNAANGYKVVRLCDQVTLSEGHSSRQAAVEALLSHASLR